MKAVARHEVKRSKVKVARSDVLPAWVCTSIRLYMLFCARSTIGGITQCCDPSVRPSVCLRPVFLVLCCSPIQMHSIEGSTAR